ncbi:MAG: aminotransferase class I/II-fold pyridoxal phosphate-dependent enzyme [Acidimicrobiales bacterium]|nr:aminotransferase class I/II-fold pyridoxal phosphate-dependent enzyme [Hyphomonadaceae bacterium]RZV41793.1 MAG: aminotransferase class I/II-fold pyridoxal phosphate-dependent enzyme [Acidimicrobiales bacterium]
MTLDPNNWKQFRATAHKMLDASINKLKNAKEGRVWTPLSEHQKSIIHSDVPVEGTPTSEMQSIMEGFLPYGVGNTHPRFFGWVNGAGAPSGLLADIATCGMNINAGGRNHIAPVVECEVVRWSAEIMGMPKGTSGLVVTGTSMATIVALKVARDTAKRALGKQPGDQVSLVGYTGAQTHSCVERAFDLLGLGVRNLRKIPCNDDFEIDLDALKTAIKKDRADGLTPFVIIGTAGAVNMGAIDDLNGLADIAESEDLWFHVDGAFGATAVLSKAVKHRLDGLSRVDSLAFDFHKWFQVNYDAGCVLIKDESAHRASFAARPAYLRSSERGLAGGAFWAVDYGPELSRGFRALKVWAHIKEHGIKALGKVVDRNIEQAQYLKSQIEAAPELELLAPVPLNICCFRYVPKHLETNELNSEIAIQLQLQGIAVPSTTTIKEKLAIRTNLTNHRTRKKDLDILVEYVVKIGAELDQPDA